MTDTPPAPALIRIAAGEGEPFAIAGATLTWKVRSRDAGADFCFFEQRLAPGEGVPLHTHSYPEAFYILSGVVEFAEDAAPERVQRCVAGDVVLARAGALHMFFNRGTEPARLLSISVGAHQAFFDAVAAADRAAPFSALAPAEAMARVAAIGAETDVLFAPPAPEAASNA
ncbi:cupin domain-containing protein [Sphingomonas morindae]|uniref:Cupin domain-containing protein n=1 Tax=Sphingomonas morindae TaxID=1541170 RepID=A0ABY4XDE6_9SPHN|nr:cupin domain-containing protein [Sphingomonas morindae]USI74947.1 cupin domain-containing protein [Sphingomonas morindae]